MKNQIFRLEKVLRPNKFKSQTDDSPNLLIQIKTLNSIHNRHCDSEEDSFVQNHYSDSNQMQCSVTEEKNDLKIKDKKFNMKHSISQIDLDNDLVDLRVALGKKRIRGMRQQPIKRFSDLSEEKPQSEFSSTQEETPNQSSCSISDDSYQGDYKMDDTEPTLEPTSSVQTNQSFYNQIFDKGNNFYTKEYIDSIIHMTNQQKSLIHWYQIWTRHQYIADNINFQDIKKSQKLRHKSYADLILNKIDPNNEYITHRLYRDSCLLTPDQQYIKDLSRLGRDLSSTILVDNSILAFGYQLNNGIPIPSYYGQPWDQELFILTKLLAQFLEAKVNNGSDFRALIQGMFQLEQRLEAFSSQQFQQPQCSQNQQLEQSNQQFKQQIQSDDVML
ncbi:scp1-like small phosphatase 5 [Stylonychia lemnae]|uniref:Mitochondrial import inner membrane translocase subunit TIM50 n=1 Tax=Stylonychia lemnae TaxID=5949 RepID=A0A078B4S8_STYLE|nr:scp1-like small phosphatase 5 [Stylonychia lemnae]|eukprot:CDW89266.1 scp1-like small phosphatase 5 [Stylonychia lemnae]